MKILIINGYTTTKTAGHAAAKYRRLVESIFSEMKEMIDTEVEFILRDKDSIVDMLYEIDSSFVKLEAARTFDGIDMIFFEGDANLRPWSPTATRFLVLLRMCIKTRKLLFASSFAMQALVFLVASNAEKTVNIINGLNGSELGDLSKLTKDLREIRQDDLFLDNVTGDLYSFNYDTGEWSSKGNAGLHFRRAAEEFKTVGKYIIKAPTYKSKTLKELQQLYVSKLNETVCSMRKNNMHHFLFQQVPFEFMVPFKNTWDVHPFNFVNPKKTFVTLADSEKGPMIVFLHENITGVQFNLDAKYPITIQILRNFIKYQLSRICSMKIDYIPIEEASIQKNDNPLDQILESQARSKYQEHKIPESQKIKFNVITEFHHAGYAAKKSSTLEVVLNNAIGSGKMKKVVQKNSTRQQQIYMPITEIESEVQEEEVEESNKKENEEFKKTKSEIRALLHPQIDKGAIPKSEHLWIPGQLKANMNLTQTSFSQSKSRKRRSIPCEFRYESTPYVTQDEIYRKHEQEKAKKILASKKFICTGASKDEFIPNYVRRSPSEHPAKHQYRIQNRDKWVSENFKF